MIKEDSGFSQGKIIKHSLRDNPKLQHKLWFVSYKEKFNKENDCVPRILFNTCSISRDTALEQKKKLDEAKIFDGYELNIVSIDANLGNFTYHKNIKDEDREKIDKLKIKNYFIVDTETTGFTNYDEVIDLAAVRVENGKIVDKFQRFIIPTKKISEDSIKIHGLTKDFLEKNGVTAKTAFREFKDFMECGYPVVGHNIVFDKRMIENHSKKAGVPLVIEVAFDTQRVAEKMIVLPDYKLANIVDYFDFRENLKSHSALDDVLGTFKFAIKLQEIYVEAKEKKNV